MRVAGASPSSAPTFASVSDNGTGSSPAYARHVAHAASSTWPASTRSMRSAEIPRGTVPAVVTNVWPASRCATSATRALVVELAEHVVEQEHR